MNKVLYYSNTGCSLDIAQYISRKCGYEMQEITTINCYDYANLFIVFPVHCQNIPRDIIEPLKKIKADNIIVIATYGKMSYGRVLWETAKILNGNICGGAYIPTKHSYLPNDSKFTDYQKLDCLIDKINTPTPVVFPKTKKNLFASFLKETRSRLGVCITKTNKCTNCGICNTVCKNINAGITNYNCIRCLKCVQKCPHNALKYELNFFMKLYLRKTRCNKTIIIV